MLIFSVHIPPIPGLDDIARGAVIASSNLHTRSDELLRDLTAGTSCESIWMVPGTEDVP